MENEKIKTAESFIKPVHKPNFQVSTVTGESYWISRSVAVLAIVVCQDDNGWHILVNKRGEGCPDYNGCWNIPCGYIDWGETCEEACSREIFEECGIKIHPEMFKLFNVNSDPRDSSRQNITIRYIANELISEYLDLELSSKNSEQNEVADIRWISFDEIDNYEWAFNHRELLDVIHNYLTNERH